MFLLSDDEFVSPIEPLEEIDGPPLPPPYADPTAAPTLGASQMSLAWMGGPAHDAPMSWAPMGGAVPDDGFFDVPPEFMAPLPQSTASPRTRIAHGMRTPPGLDEIASELEKAPDHMPRARATRIGAMKKRPAAWVDCGGAPSQAARRTPMKRPAAARAPAAIAPDAIAPASPGVFL